MFVDLHTHTTFSDGTYTPTKLVDEYFKLGVQVLAITDHDCVDGVQEALEATKKYDGKMKIIPGVELSTENDNRPVHILGYYVDVNNKPMLETMAWLRDSRDNRLFKMIDRLAELGFNISVDDCRTEGKTIGRPHVAKALVQAGYFDSVQEAFDKLLHFGGPAYITHAKLSPKEAVDLIHAAGGIAILAHPSEICDDDMVLELLDSIAFDGIEVYHPANRPDKRLALIKQWANERNLLIGGGTDFHGVPDRFPNKLGIWMVNYDDVKGIIEWK